jgi:hypothetical protein
MSAVEKWKTGACEMAKLIMRAKLNGGPDVEHRGKIETLADLPRFLRGGEATVRKITKLFPALRSHKIEKLTIQPE